jgi:hypothetical protein
MALPGRVETTPAVSRASRDSGFTRFGSVPQAAGLKLIVDERDLQREQLAVDSKFAG